MTARSNIRSLAFVVIAVLAAVSFVRAANSPATRNLGIEGVSNMVLPRGDYQARPMDDRSELLLNVQSVEPADAGGFRYKIQYMGMEPGEYSLAEFLMRPDGSRPEEIKDFRLHVRAELPEDHNGQLEQMSAAPFPFIGGYRIFLGFLGLLWVAGIVMFIRSYRKKKVVTVEAVVVLEPGFAERIRPLVESAAAGTITLEDQTLLERLLMGFWREKLELTEPRVAEAVLLLKQHPVAGELLRAMERWLHRPGGSSAAEINPLLEPYRNAPENLTSEEAPA
jgi:hypothetical protein